MNSIPIQYREHGLLCRWIVLEMLRKVLVDKMLISEIKEDYRFSYRYLIPEQKARSLSLLETILRNLSVIDKIINVYLRQKPNSRIVNILRIAAAEILYDSIATHAAVDSAVRLTKSDKRLVKFAGLVNAICRKIANKGLSANNFGSPLLSQQLITGLKNTYDLNTIKEFGIAQKQRPPVDITIKEPSKEIYYYKLLAGRILPSGSIRLQHKNQISKLPGFDEGAWWVQDFSSAMPVRLFGKIEGLSALDVCAAPGGKTMQLAAAGASVTAIEISRERATKLKNNLNRTNLMAEIIVEDIKKFRTAKLFDIVLVDAPCSATGTIRRNCDLQYLDPLKRVKVLVRQQKAILKKAMSFVKPGGRLLYCTCSLLPEEGESIIEETLKYCFNWKQLIVDVKNFDIDPDWVDSSGGLRLRPDYWKSIGGMDGFYIAMLKKIDFYK